LNQGKGVIVSTSDPIERQDGSLVEIGPEAAIPIFVKDDILAVLSVVKPRGERFSPKEFLLMQDFSETLGNILLTAKKHWVTTQEKIQINQMLTHLSPFVPESVRAMVRKNPQMLDREKRKKQVSVLFLDLEGYTKLSSSRQEAEVNEFVERIFSSFVDPIHRSHGEINETAGDGLMIVFQTHDARTNAVNSVKAAFEIYHRNREIQRELRFSAESIPVNIGINSGEALVGMSRFAGALDIRMTYTASGPVTNLAARLADYGVGGGILIGEETRKLIAGLWPTYDLGFARLKGIEQPIRVHSLFAENAAVA
jgi:class 3 adenylate cyclase